MSSGPIIGDFWALNDIEKEIINEDIKKYQKLIKYALINLVIIGFVFPIALSWAINASIKSAEYYEENGLPEPNEFSTTLLITVIVFMSLFIGAIILFAFYMPLRNLQSDIHKGQKMLVPVKVIRKQYVSVNQSYFLHTFQKKSFSIEVNQQDYIQTNVGEDIYLFYTPKSGIYLGYRTTL